MKSELAPNATALLIHHFISRPDEHELEERVADSLPGYVRLLAHCRARGVLLVYMITERHAQIGAEILPVVAPLAGDIVHRTPNLSGVFESAPFEQMLRDHGRDTLLITGISVDRGCSSTARQALNREIRAIVVRGACFGDQITESPVGPVTREDIERVTFAVLHRQGVEIMDVDEVIAGLG